MDVSDTLTGQRAAIDTLLMVNNYRDREQDVVSGKRTLVVTLREAFAENMYLGLGIALYCSACVLCIAAADTPRVHLGTLRLLYMHALTWRKMVSIRSGEKTEPDIERLRAICSFWDCCWHGAGSITPCNLHLQVSAGCDKLSFITNRSTNQKQEPLPTSLSTPISPPSCSMNFY
jgi:hypothetical protein